MQERFPTLTIVKVNLHIALSLGVGEETELRRGGESPTTVSHAPEGRRSLTWAWKRFNCTAEGDHTGTGNQLPADRVSFSLYI